MDANVATSLKRLACDKGLVQDSLSIPDPRAHISLPSAKSVAMLARLERLVYRTNFVRSFVCLRGRVASVDRYTAAVKLLFDPDNAQVDLLSLEIKVSQARVDVARFCGTTFVNTRFIYSGAPRALLNTALACFSLAPRVSRPKGRQPHFRGVAASGLPQIPVAPVREALHWNDFVHARPRWLHNSPRGDVVYHRARRG